MFLFLENIFANVAGLNFLCEFPWIIFTFHRYICFFSGRIPNSERLVDGQLSLNLSDRIRILFDSMTSPTAYIELKLDARTAMLT